MAFLGTFLSTRSLLVAQSYQHKMSALMANCQICMIASHTAGRALETAFKNGVFGNIFGHTVTRGDAVLGA